MNSENQAQVQSPRDQNLEDLLEELRDVCDQRIQLIRGLSDDQLARLVPGSQRADLQWAELLGSSRHADAHVQMVRNAMAESRA